MARRKAEPIEPFRRTDEDRLEERRHLHVQVHKAQLQRDQEFERQIAELQTDRDAARKQAVADVLELLRGRAADTVPPISIGIREAIAFIEQEIA